MNENEKCEATTNPICFVYTLNENEDRFPRCRKGQTVEIDGLKLCRQHAGQIALMKLIGRGEVTVLRDTLSCKTFDNYSNQEDM